MNTFCLNGKLVDTYSAELSAKAEAAQMHLCVQAVRFC